MVEYSDEIRRCWVNRGVVGYCQAFYEAFAGGFEGVGEWLETHKEKCGKRETCVTRGRELYFDSDKFGPSNSNHFSKECGGLDEQVREELVKTNKQDTVLYERVKELFYRRVEEQGII